MPGQTIFEAARFGFQNEESQALTLLFPFANKFQKLQMMTQNTMGVINPLTVMGIFRRKFKSEVLGMFQEERGINMIAFDRLGRQEGAEVTASRRLKGEEDDE
jgi:hypothetical protein